MWATNSIRGSMKNKERVKKEEIESRRKDNQMKKSNLPEEITLGLEEAIKYRVFQEEMKYHNPASTDEGIDWIERIIEKLNVQEFISSTITRTVEECIEAIDEVRDRYKCGACHEGIKNLGHTMLCEAFKVLKSILERKR